MLGCRQLKCQKGFIAARLQNFPFLLKLKSIISQFKNYLVQQQIITLSFLLLLKILNCEQIVNNFLWKLLVFMA